MILFAALIAVSVPLVAQDAIPWITDLRQAREVAERQNRLVLLHFWSDDCAPCKQLERNVFSRPEFIRALTTGYVPVKINASLQPQLAEFYNIERVPTDVIVTPEGREVQRFQSLQDSNQYIAMLDGIRAQASVGAYTPMSPNASPVTTQPQQQAANTSPYGAASPLQTEQSRYGQGGYGQSSSGPSATSEATSTPIYTQNRYANPLAQPTAPQQQELAPRYANPYEQEAPSSNTAGSRWGQPTSGSDGNGATYPQRAVTPQANQFVAPEAGGEVAGQGTSQPAQQYGGASQPRASQNQEGYSQPTQNQSPGGAGAQPGFNGGSQPQISIPQAQPAPAEPQISLEGYCPVTLVQNRIWTPGDKKWGAVHEGRIYLFAGREQQQQFLANPQVYAPLMAGYDPVRFAETGQLVPGRREFGLYIDEPGPIALFADEAALERFHANSNYYFNVIRQAKTQQAGRTTR